MNDYLNSNYGNFVGEERTRQLLSKMDKVERGEINYTDLLNELYKEIQLIDRVKEKITVINVLIALLHLKLKELSRKHNVEKAKKLMKMARDRNVKLVVLPSLFPVGNTFEIYSNEKKLRSMVKNLAEKIPGNNTDILINLAMEGEMHVIAGPLLEQAGPKIFLTSLVLSPQGEIIGKYRKVIISDKDIKLGISGGKEPVYTLLDKRYGIISEDDLYSPEISRILSIFGAQAVIGTMKAMANNQEMLKHLAIVRSIENGIPYLINGGGYRRRRRRNKGIISDVHHYA